MTNKNNYFNYLNNSLNSELMAFADWCQFKHSELLSADFNFKQTDLVKNKELNQAYLNLSKELLLEFRTYVPSYSNAKILDVSGAYVSDEKKEETNEAIRNILSKIQRIQDDNESTLIHNNTPKNN